MNDSGNFPMREDLRRELARLRIRFSQETGKEWRPVTKLARDFGGWLQVARVFLPCVAPLLNIRLERILGEMKPFQTSETALKQLSILLREAERHLGESHLSPKAFQVLHLESLEELPFPSGEVPVPEALWGKAGFCAVYPN